MLDVGGSNSEVAAAGVVCSSVGIKVRLRVSPDLELLVVVFFVVRRMVLLTFFLRPKKVPTGC